MKKQHSWPKWIDRLVDIVHESWDYRGPCHHVNYKAKFNDKINAYEIWIAPVTQQVVGGKRDGDEIWSPFIFDVSDFAKHKQIELTHYAVASHSAKDPNFLAPQIMMKGKIRGKIAGEIKEYPFFIRLMIEPDWSTPPVELLDTIKKKVRDNKKVK